MNLLGYFIPDIFFESLILILSIIIPIVLVMIVGVRRRIPAILNARKIPYIIDTQMDETGALRDTIILISEIKKTGKLSYFKRGSGNYKLDPNKIRRRGGIANCFHVFGNPDAIDYEMPNTTKITPAEALKLITMSSEEFKEAIDTKIILDVLRYSGYTNTERSILIVSIVIIVLEVINLYFSYNTSNQFSSLIRQINALINALKGSTPVG